MSSSSLSCHSPCHHISRHALCPLSNTGCESRVSAVTRQLKPSPPILQPLNSKPEPEPELWVRRSRLPLKQHITAADHTMKEAMWLCTLLSLIGHPQSRPTLIQCDNMGAISLIENPVFHACTKHIDIKHHYVWNQYESKDVTFKDVPTSDNSTDILTKGLDHPKHWKFLSMLGLENKLNPTNLLLT